MWEMWALSLKEEHKLQVFENKFIRKIVGSEKDEICRQCNY
jgi:hypothetical protein